MVVSPYFRMTLCMTEKKMVHTVVVYTCIGLDPEIVWCLWTLPPHHTAPCVSDRCCHSSVNFTRWCMVGQAYIQITVCISLMNAFEHWLAFKILVPLHCGIEVFLQLTLGQTIRKQQAPTSVKGNFRYINDNIAFQKSRSSDREHFLSLSECLYAAHICQGHSQFLKRAGNWMPPGVWLDSYYFDTSQLLLPVEWSK